MEGSGPVLVVVYDDVEPLDVSSVTSTLTMANRHQVQPPYRVTVAALTGPVVRCDGGSRRSHGPFADWDARRWTVVSGGTGHRDAAADRLTCLTPAERVRLRSYGTAARVHRGDPARRGRPAGRADGDHPLAVRRRARRAVPSHRGPRPDLPPARRRVVTSGSVTSALDLTWRSSRRTTGRSWHARVARELNHLPAAPGNQARASLFTSVHRTDDALVRGLVERHPDADLGAPALSLPVPG
ncbi:hypothetical protein HBB16_10855 [Pseudonocardia sp. MCCB 268]|nr:hypothetical protein [Pseudonocardia cytotoxica]